ncbi:MAG TPA: sigma-70 family RNA polymerase sigma factor [bacterium]|nr:sigma-70 family RNA polymerase sigma factor [bacterium]HPG45032.1 sigma-70 family RNA polymerase sigma factor [bacterium]HPM97274.1 sigma-70 family RNA polymerase sigma factor [bacterium]
MDPSNSNLIHAALNGDQQAYKEIVNRFYGKIFALVLRMVKNRQEAEDLTQETFIKAFNSLATFNSEYAFSTWLYKIAANTCIDHFRKKRLLTFPLDNPITMQDSEMQREYPDQQEPEPDNRLINKERTTIIEDAISSLPAKYRQVIILRHKRDKSYEEIAEELALPLGTVKVRIFRAREMLKKALRDQLRG